MSSIYHLSKVDFQTVYKLLKLSKFSGKALSSYVTTIVPYKSFQI